MTGEQPCQDLSDAKELNRLSGLFLKPVARISVSVQLPTLKAPGKSVSNWELMEKLKNAVKPESFLFMKVTKNSAEFIKFEAEIETRDNMGSVITKLDSSVIKLSGFPEKLRVRAGPAKISFPNRHDWESFFRDAKNMNEMKPGERPDTIHFKDLPCKFFANIKKPQDRGLPDEFVVRKVFEVFGDIRRVDVPCIDPYRKRMRLSRSKMNTFTPGQGLTFDAYVQFKDYIGFVKAMTALRGMKLVQKDLQSGQAYVANIKVDFDRTKHLSDKNIRRRKLETERLLKEDWEEEQRMKYLAEEERKKVLEEKQRKLEELERKMQRRREREEKRRQARAERRKVEAARRMMTKIQVEERKLLVTQRKLESIRLLTELFENIKIIKQKEDVQRKLKELELERIKQLENEKAKELKRKEKKARQEEKKHVTLLQREETLRAKLRQVFKRQKEREAETVREQLREKVIKQRTKLRSVLTTVSSTTQHDESQTTSEEQRRKYYEDMEYDDLRQEYEERGKEFRWSGSSDDGGDGDGDGDRDGDFDGDGDGDGDGEGDAKDGQKERRESLCENITSDDDMDDLEELAKKDDESRDYRPRLPPSTDYHIPYNKLPPRPRWKHTAVIKKTSEGEEEKVLEIKDHSLHSDRISAAIERQKQHDEHDHREHRDHDTFRRPSPSYRGRGGRGGGPPGHFRPPLPLPSHDFRRGRGGFFHRPPPPPPHMMPPGAFRAPHPPGMYRGRGGGPGYRGRGSTYWTPRGGRGWSPRRGRGGPFHPYGRYHRDFDPALKFEPRRRPERKDDDEDDFEEESMLDVPLSSAVRKLPSTGQEKFRPRPRPPRHDGQEEDELEEESVLDLPLSSVVKRSTTSSSSSSSASSSRDRRCDCGNRDCFYSQHPELIKRSSSSRHHY